MGGPFFERRIMSEEKTCKQCEHYEKYEGDKLIDGKKAIMFCPKRKALGGVGYYSNLKICGSEYFTPKKPEPKKTIEDCNETCKYSWKNNLAGGVCSLVHPKEFAKCRYGGFYSNWTPCESKEPEKPKPVDPNRPCKDCDRSIYYAADCGEIDFECDDNNSGWIPVGSRTIADYKYAGEIIFGKYKPNLIKEKVMWNKVVHLIRMSVLVLCLVGMFNVGSFVNPKLVWIADVVLPLGDKAVQLETGETVMMKMSYGDHFFSMPGKDNFSVWIVFVLAIAVAVAIPYLLHVATLKLFNVRKK